jgi:hypothetical protein
MNMNKFTAYEHCPFSFVRSLLIILPDYIFVPLLMWIQFRGHEIDDDCINISWEPGLDKITKLHPKLIMKLITNETYMTTE